jgi:hypothetical protein
VAMMNAFTFAVVGYVNTLAAVKPPAINTHKLLSLFFKKIIENHKRI